MSSNSGDHRIGAPASWTTRSVFERLSGPIQDRSDQRGALIAPNASHDDRPRNENQVITHHQRTKTYVTCYACGEQGHYARKCARLNIPGLWPIIHFDSFRSPPEQAWAEGEVESWFRYIGPTLPFRQVSKFKELVKDLFPNF